MSTRAIESCCWSRCNRCSRQVLFGDRDILCEVAGSALVLDLSGRRCRHGVLRDLRTDSQDCLDHGRGQGHETFGQDVCGRNPRVVAVEAGDGQTGFDVIVCPARQRAGRSGEVVSIGLFC